MSNDALSPREARRWYLQHRRDDTRYATQQSQEAALDWFVDWADQAGIDEMAELSGRDLMAFKTWRKETADPKLVSLNGTLAILRRFLKFCEQIEVVDPDLHEKVPLPNVSDQDQICEEVPEDKAVEGIREYYRRFEYASRPHVEFELAAELGLRMGAIRGIDVDDVDLGAQVIRFRHRPEAADVKGTPLKNGRDGQRNVNLPDDLSQAIRDYIEHTRVDVTDEFGREPLVTTAAGRPELTTIRRDFYKMTRPCVYSGECPHGKDMDSCRARKSAHASECPSSFSPHPLRRWSIMSHLDAGMPKDDLSDRVDVSVPVLNKHYDRRSEARKSRRRREELAERLSGYSVDDELGSGEPDL